MAKSKRTSKLIADIRSDDRARNQAAYLELHEVAHRVARKFGTSRHPSRADSIANSAVGALIECVREDKNPFDFRGEWINFLKNTVLNRGRDRARKDGRKRGVMQALEDIDPQDTTPNPEAGMGAENEELREFLQPQVVEYHPALLSSVSGAIQILIAPKADVDLSIALHAVVLAADDLNVSLGIVLAKFPSALRPRVSKRMSGVAFKDFGTTLEEIKYRLHAAESLKPDTHLLIAMREAGYTFPEIGKKLKRSEDAVRQAHRRASLAQIAKVQANELADSAA